MLESMDAMSRFINLLTADDATKNVMNLLIHSWIQARGLHGAAEGYQSGASAKTPVKSTNLALIFSKLWYESIPGELDRQTLKPFGSAIVSAGLQIGEYQEAGVVAAYSPLRVFPFLFRHLQHFSCIQ